MLKRPCMKFSKKNSNENTQIHMCFPFFRLIGVFFFLDRFSFKTYHVLSLVLSI